VALFSFKRELNSRGFREDGTHILEVFFRGLLDLRAILLTKEYKLQRLPHVADFINSEDFHVVAALERL
jgi:hypothetical protein